MVAVTIANFLAILIAVLGRINRQERLGLLSATLLLIIFYSIRADYGNDLPGYIDIFNAIKLFSFQELIENKERLEPGWIFLNLFFSPFGWQPLLIVLTIIQFGTVYWLISRYAFRSYYWLIFTIYVLNSGLLLTDLSMLRQALAMHICCWSLPSILTKRYVKSILIILLASTFHTSAYIALILIVLPFLCNLNSKYIMLIFLSIYIVFTILDAMVGDILAFFLNTETFEKYEIYSHNTEIGGSGIGMVFQVFTVCWLFLKHSKHKQSKFFNSIFSMGILMIPFSNEIPIIVRIGMYFNLIGIISYQELVNYKKDIIGFVLLIMSIYIYFSGYFSFFESPVWKDGFGMYKTIFD